jgi:acetate kinase
VVHGGLDFSAPVTSDDRVMAGLEHPVPAGPHNRSGRGTRIALDPGVVLYLLQQKEMTAEAIERLLHERSSLLGVSGLSSDMRVLLASDATSVEKAIELFIYRIGREPGSRSRRWAASMG